jgi:hypothetical protein
MIPLSAETASATSGALTWTKISCNRQYELKRNGVVVGKLTRPSLWSQKFVADTQHGRWTFRRSGFWGTTCEIVDAAGRVVASCKAGYGRSVVSFADGQTFHFAHKGWWRPVWTVTSDNGQPLLYVHRREKTVDLSATTSVADDRLTLLSMFVWYRILQEEEDAASVAVMVAVGA